MKRKMGIKLGMYMLTAVLAIEVWGNAEVVYAEEKDDIKESAQVQNASDTYVVQKGDCLWLIAVTLYGNGSKWEELYELNREVIGADPNFLLAGTELKLLEKESKGEDFKEAIEETGEIGAVEGGKELADRRWLVYWADDKAYYLHDMDCPEQTMSLGKMLDEATDRDVFFSADGKYIYYGSTWDVKGLYRINVEDAHRDRNRVEEYWEVITEDADRFELVGDGSTLVYKDSADTLFYFDGKESKVIAKQVSYYKVEEDRVDYLLETQEERFYPNSYLFEENTKIYYDNYKTELLRNDKDIKSIYPTGNGKKAVFYTKIEEETGNCELYYYEEGKGGVLISKGLTEGNVVSEPELGIVLYMKADGTVCYSVDGTEQELGLPNGSLLFDWQGYAADGTLMLGYMEKKEYDRYKEEVRSDQPQIYTANHRFLVSYVLKDGKLIPGKRISERYYRGAWYGNVYYFSECEEEYELSILGEQYRVELWCWQNGKKYQLGDDTLIDRVAIYEDGGVMAWLWNDFENIGVNDGNRLRIYDAEEGFFEITERATTAYYLNKNRILYMQEGTLYLYTKEQGSKVVAENVEEYDCSGAYVNTGYSIL